MLDGRTDCAEPGNPSTASPACPSVSSGRECAVALGRLLFERLEARGGPGSGNAGPAALGALSGPCQVVGHGDMRTSAGAHTVSGSPTGGYAFRRRAQPAVLVSTWPPSLHWPSPSGRQVETAGSGQRLAWGPLSWFKAFPKERGGFPRLTTRGR